jgi:hypothetical protein
VLKGTKEKRCGALRGVALSCGAGRCVAGRCCGVLKGTKETLRSVA